MTSRLGRFVLIGMAILIVVSLWRAVTMEREKRRVAKAYDQAQQTLKQVEEERAHLNEELLSAHNTIEQQTGDMQNLQQDLKTLDQRLANTTTELTSLQREHEQLRQSNASLTSQFAVLTTQKQELEAKLSSLQELRLAIHDVKRKLRDERLAAWRAHIQAEKVADQERLASGNRGYLVRNGTRMLGSRTKLQVRVLEPQSQ